METLIQNHYPHELAKPHWQEAAGYLVRTATGEWDISFAKPRQLLAMSVALAK
jgi:hypothetical protein